MRQGCPLAPLLFIIAGEVLNVLLREAESEGKISGIKLPNSTQTQLISQFADDTSISIEVSQPHTIRNLLDILNLFRLASGLEINWSKSHAF